MSALTPEQLAEGKRLHEAATPGPWAVDDSPYSSYTWGPKMEMISDECGHCASYRLRGHGGGLPQEANATLIAWMRTNLPALLAAAESVGMVRRHNGELAEIIKAYESRLCAVCNDKRTLSDAKAWDCGERDSDCPFCPDVVQETLKELASLRAQLTAREQENAEQGTEINRLEKVVAKFIVADVQRSVDAMMSGPKELQDTLFFVDTQRMKAVREKEAAQAEVERISKLLDRAVGDDMGDYQCEHGQVLTRECVECDASWLKRRKAALAPSQPPQTTETMG